jgi:DNA-binding NtrC family response regulator
MKTFQKKKKTFAGRKNYSVVNKLLKDGLINEYFLTMVQHLSLEDLIAIKLEMATKTTGVAGLFGIPLYKNTIHIVKDAMIKFAISATRTKSDAASFLGISLKRLSEEIKKYDVKNYFNE